MMMVAAAGAWFWQNSLAARERANIAAIEACERLSLQFLDGTVAFARLTLVRTAGGRLALQRTYVFDYTADSIQRHQGFVVLTALRVESVGYAPGEESRAASATQQQPPLQVDARSNVLDIEAWRARRRQQPGRSSPRREDRGDGRQ